LTFGTSSFVLGPASSSKVVDRSKFTGSSSQSSSYTSSSSSSKSPPAHS